MILRELTGSELKALYKVEITSTFPPNERKPLRILEELWAQKRYEPLGLWEGDELLGYALMWVVPEHPFVLLDYLGTPAKFRGQGLGSELLTLLGERYAHLKGILAEAEDPELCGSEGADLRRRRLGFYQRNGFRDGGYSCAVFGTPYRPMLRSQDPVNTGELMEFHKSIYRDAWQSQSRHLYERYVQIPLRPGEAVNDVTDEIE